MEQVGSLVPVDPHAAEVVAKQVVQRVPGEEAEAVRDPVGLIWVVEEVGLNASPQVADCLGSLLVSARPDTQGNAVERV